MTCDCFLQKMKQLHLEIVIQSSRVLIQPCSACIAYKRKKEHLKVVYTLQQTKVGQNMRLQYNLCTLHHLLQCVFFFLDCRTVIME